jgi:glycosyltransferase involved in cell wall biosynthesis
MKKRILMVNEASYLATGYSVYGLELLTRLYNTDKYEIAELGAFGQDNDPRIHNIPWKFYPNQPPDNTSEAQHFLARQSNIFGEWRFDKTCLDFKPHIVFAVRDYWMDEFIGRSPFRPYFKWAEMPTVDSAPQDEEWIASYVNADAVLTYSEFGYNTLLKESSGLIKLAGIASPGANFNDFPYITDKSKAKQEMGIPQDAFIIGTVMRNQERKLYPDLIKSFAMLLEQAPSELAKKSYLYLHTGYPDVGWKIPTLLKRYGILSKTLFTYFCNPKNGGCGVCYPSFYQDARAFCRNCGQYLAVTPGVHMGVSRQALGKILGIFDVYVQYATCLPAGQLILLQSGWTPIEQVKVGDCAYTHKHRFMPVIRTFTSTTNRLYNISVNGDYEKLKITGNHPAFSITQSMFNNKNISVRDNIGTYIRLNKKLPQPQFTRTDELNIGDLLVYPINDNIEDVSIIDLAKFANGEDLILDNYIEVYNGKTYPRWITIDNEFCKFIGLFAADGCSGTRTNSNIKVTSHINETKHIQLSTDVLHKMSNRNTISIRGYKDRLAIDTIMCSRLHANIFINWCGKSINKKLPDWSLLLPLDKQKNILIGLFMGDGYYIKDRNTSVYTTISPILAEQVKTLLRRNRICYNCHLDHKCYKGNRRVQYRFEAPGDIANGIFVTTRHNTRNIYINNYHCIQIKSIDIINSNETVYNFEVAEDNSYTSKVANLHNCEGYGIPLVEAGATGAICFAVDYSAMHDIIKKINGYAVRPINMFCDPRTHSERAMPDNQDFVNKLIEVMKLSPKEKQTKSAITAELVRKHCSWDNTVKVWEQCFDNLTVLNDKQSWQSSSRITQPNMNIPQNLNNSDFVNWIITHIAGRPELLNSYISMRMIRDLTWGASQQTGKWADYTRQDVINEMTRACEQKNAWEKVRLDLENYN